MNAFLRTWKLMPTGTPSALWSLSSFVAAAYVRAQGPLEARELAAQRFSKYREQDPDGNGLRSPFLDPDLVYCVEVPDQRFGSPLFPEVITVLEAAGSEHSTRMDSEIETDEETPATPLGAHSSDWSTLGLAK